MFAGFTNREGDIDDALEWRRRNIQERKRPLREPKRILPRVGSKLARVRARVDPSQRRARRRRNENARRARRREQCGRSFRRHEYEPVRRRKAAARAATLASRTGCAVCGGALYIPKTGNVPTMCSRKCRARSWYLAQAKARGAAGLCSTGCGTARENGKTRCAVCHKAMLAASRVTKAKQRAREAKAA